MADLSRGGRGSGPAARDRRSRAGSEPHSGVPKARNNEVPKIVDRIGERNIQIRKRSPRPRPPKTDRPRTPGELAPNIPLVLVLLRR